MRVRRIDLGLARPALAAPPFDDLSALTHGSAYATSRTVVAA